jgi:hypothetical protein
MRKIIATSVILLSLATGCGSGTGTGSGGSPGVQALEPEVNYAQMIRVEVAEIGNSMQQEEGVAAGEGQVEMLLENMEGYEEKPVGEHKAVYDQIYQGAKDLKAMYERKAPANEIQEKAQELATVAEQLPKPPEAATP